MKAVYEMPKVSFEAFMANNAVSSCGWSQPKFDCVLGEGKEFGDFHGDRWNDSPESGNVFSSSITGRNCGINAGFADYVNGDWKEDSFQNDPGDNISNTQVNGTIFVDFDTANITDGDTNNSFMGWLYVTQWVSYDRGNLTYHYDTKGWNTNNNQLNFTNPRKIIHAWLAPLFSAKSTSGM